MAADEDEGCAAGCRKLLFGVLPYLGSFLAAASAFVAFDVASNSARLGVPTNWVEDIKVDVWFGPRTYVYHMLLACTVVSVISFTMELACIFMNYGNVFNILKYAALVNVVIIVLLTVPACIVGICWGTSLLGASESPEKITGKLFDDYNKYLALRKNRNDVSVSDYDLVQNLSNAQERLDWIQQGQSCCGMDGAKKDYSQLRPALIFQPDSDNRTLEERIPARLHWWLNGTDPSRDIRLPRSCCKQEGDCFPSSAFRLSCKTQILQLLVRRITYACGLMLGAALFGVIGAILYFRTAVKGIEVQKRQHQWLARTGQLAQADDD